MSKLLYFMTTFLESGLSVVGLRGAYEQPPYQIVRTIPPDVEIRAYGPRTAVETTDPNQGEAFGRLFRYITGANTAHSTLSRQAPVESGPQMIAMTVPVELSGGMDTMRFFLPASVVRAGVPTPTEAHVRIVTLPPQTLGVIRYSGFATNDRRTQELARLRLALAAAGIGITGAPVYFSYDPPFALPFLRRNEVGVPAGEK